MKQITEPTQQTQLPASPETRWVSGQESPKRDWLQFWPVEAETESEARITPNLPENPEEIQDQLRGVRSESQGE